MGAFHGSHGRGYRGCESDWGDGYWRLGMRLGLVLGDGNAFGAE